MNIEEQRRYLHKAIKTIQENSGPATGYIKPEQYPGFDGFWSDSQFQWLRVLDPISKLWESVDKDLIKQEGRIK